MENFKKNIGKITINNNCTGCRMCEQLCPKRAIQIVENKEGFLEPRINESKCVNCGLCLKMCPQNHNNLSREPIMCYAAKNKDIEQLKIGSSGSIFKIIADYIIDNCGVVYGAAFDENLELNTIRVVKKEDVLSLTGSKYVQSNTNNTFKFAKKDLDENRLVLFTGTPCQIAGLKSYLNKEYENLITIDLVCHGVPSPKLFREYIKYLQKKYNSKIKKYYFRNKEKNGWGYNIKIILENGKVLFKSAVLDCYYKSFMNSIDYRESCYKCKYANINRIGDITLADYWGIKKEHPKMQSDYGVSAILINTIKGENIFNKINNKIEFIQSNIQKIKRENINLNHSVRRPQVRDNIYEGLGNKKFERYIKENLKFKMQLKDILKTIIPLKVKKWIKNILGENVQ